MKVADCLVQCGRSAAALLIDDFIGPAVVHGDGNMSAEQEESAESNDDNEGR